MACLVRIELHGSNDYTALHQQMEAWGFSRVALTGANLPKQLPTGLYAFYGAGTPQQVYGYANLARNAIGALATIFVGEWTTMWWGDLPDP